MAATASDQASVLREEVGGLLGHNKHGWSALVAPACRHAAATHACVDAVLSFATHFILHPQVGQLQRQYADAKRNYDNEVVQHGDALKRYAGELQALANLACRGLAGGFLVIGGELCGEASHSAGVVTSSSCADGLHRSWPLPCPGPQPWRPPRTACNSG